MTNVPGSEHKASACSQLADNYRQRRLQPSDPQRLRFAGVGERDVYNITAPFLDEGVPVIAGRVEARDSEYAHVVFFIEEGDVWRPREGAPEFALQDPFYTHIHGQLIVGGVHVFPHPDNDKALQWRTVFYRGDRVNTLRPFFTGPDGMKDLRLVELRDGGIGVFTRPQGEKGGRGKIGFAQVADLDALTVEAVEQAPLLRGQFLDSEWGGANEPHLLTNGIVGVLGHIACFGERGERHYYPMAFAFDPITLRHSPPELIAERADFLPGGAKRPDLADVVFSGGLVRQPDGTAVLYAGISDAEAHRITIPDPFLRFEGITNL